MKTEVCVTLSDELKKRIDIIAKKQNKDFSEEIEKYLRIAIIGEDNPDLPFSFINDILEAKKEKEKGLGRPFNIE